MARREVIAAALGHKRKRRGFYEDDPWSPILPNLSKKLTRPVRPKRVKPVDNSFAHRLRKDKILPYSTNKRMYS